MGINLDAYASAPAGSQAFGAANAQELNDLTKALEATALTGRETTNLTTASGAPLKIESLDKTLKLLTFKEQEIVLWKKISKEKAFNTVEEYNQLDSYGEDRGGFITEGELPQEENSRYIRRAQLVKFIGFVGSVTHVMTLTNNVVGDLVNRESQNKSLLVLQTVNKALTKADSSIVPEEFNGLYAQHAKHDGSTFYGGSFGGYLTSDIVVDCRGSKLTETIIEDAAERIVENHGFGNDLFAPPKVLSQFTTNFHGNKLIQPNTSQVNEAVMGQRVVGVMSNFGKIDLNYDVFMNKPAPFTATATASHSKAPAAPVPDGVAPVTIVASDSSSKFVTGDAGDYLWSVRAVNRFGLSASALMSSTPSTIAALSRADLKFAAGVGAEAATGYVIYRTKKNDTTPATAKFYELFRVSLADLATGFDGGASASKIGDRNRFIPDTDQSFLVQNDSEVMQFKQLAPLMKMDLAVISPSYRFMVMLYGTPMLYTPKKMVRFINIGLL